MKRRNFLQSAALASTAALMAPSALANSLKRERISEFGFQSYTVRDVIYKDMPGTLKRLRKAGFDNMEGFDFGNGGRRPHGHGARRARPVLRAAGLRH